MKYFRLLAKLTAVLALFSLVAPQVAYAYLDPGTGSYMLQMLLGILVGGLFAVKIFWKNIRSFFANLLARGRRGGEGSE